MTIDFFYGLLVGGSCACLVLGVAGWVTRRRAEKRASNNSHPAKMTATIVRERAISGGGLICMVGQVWATLLTFAVLYANASWRSDTVALIVVWATAVLALGSIGANFGSRETFTCRFDRLQASERGGYRKNPEEGDSS